MPKARLLSKGFFSPLQQAVQQAPMERVPMEQWETYLQPGRMISRGESQFPLKKEEIAATLERLKKETPVLQEAQTPVKKSLLSDMIEGGGAPPLIQDIRENPRYDEYRFLSPGSRYEENVTRLEGLNFPQAHYEPDTLSWSRASIHSAPEGNVRLVEEIQSDLHQSGRKKGYQSSDMENIYQLSRRISDVLQERRRLDQIGVDTPELDDQLQRLVRERDRIHSAVPDAPFKNPQQYAQLELNKQLLRAIEEGDDYLALTRGIDQIERYGGQQNEDFVKGMEHVYDNVYPSVLKKIAKRYGAEIEDVKVPIEWLKPSPLSTVEELEADSAVQFMERVGDLLSESLDIDEQLDALSDVSSILHEMKESFNLRSEPLGLGFNQIGNSLEQAFTHVEKLQDSLRKEIPYEAEDFIELDAQIRLLESWLPDRTRMVEKTFPAMKLTPEVKEKILKAGVPLFGGTGATIMIDEEKPEGFQEGGEVDTGLQRLRRRVEKPFEVAGDLGIYRVLDPLVDLFRSDDMSPEDLEQRDKRLAQLATSGFASQIMGLDPETGQATFEPREYLRALTGRSNATKPGMIDEIAALPTLIEIFGGTPPQWATEAANRQERLVDSIRQQMGIEEPRGFVEHAAESFGVMGGQLPVRTGTTTARSMGSRLKDIGRRVAEAPIEWLSPIIDPRFSNYLIGGLFGGALGALSDEDVQAQTGYASIEDLVAAAQSGDDPEAQEILMELIREMSDNPGTDLPEMQKGGKVKEAAKLTRRQLLKGLGATAAGATGLGKLARQKGLVDELAPPPAVAKTIPMGAKEIEVGFSLEDLGKRLFGVDWVEDLIDKDDLLDRLDDFSPEALSEEDWVWAIEDALTEAGMGAEEARVVIPLFKIKKGAVPDFVEVDSTNLSHGNAFYNLEVEGPEEIMEKLRQFEETGELQFGLDSPEMQKGGKVMGIRGALFKLISPEEKKKIQRLLEEVYEDVEGSEEANQAQIIGTKLEKLSNNLTPTEQGFLKNWIEAQLEDISSWPEDAEPGDEELFRSLLQRLTGQKTTLHDEAVGRISSTLEDELNDPYQKGGKVKTALKAISGGRQFKTPTDFQLRVMIPREKLADPNYLTSKEFRETARNQLAETLEDAFLDPKLADEINVLDGAQEEDLTALIEEWAAALGKTPEPGIESREVFLTVPMRGEKSLIQQFVEDLEE